MELKLIITAAMVSITLGLAAFTTQVPTPTEAAEARAAGVEARGVWQ